MITDKMNQQTKIEVLQYKLRTVADALAQSLFTRPGMKRCHAAVIRHAKAKAGRALQQVQAPSPRPLFRNGYGATITVDRLGKLALAGSRGQPSGLTIEQAGSLLAFWELRGGLHFAKAI